MLRKGFLASSKLGVMTTRRECNPAHNLYVDHDVDLKNCIAGPLQLRIVLLCLPDQLRQGRSIWSDRLLLA